MMNDLNNPSSINSGSADSSSTTTRTSTTTTQSSNTPPKRPTKFNWKVILGVIALVLVTVGAAAGFYIVQYGNLDLRQQAAVTGGGGGDACSQGTAEGQCFSGKKCVNRNLVDSNDCKRACNTAAGLLQHGQTGSGACRADSCGDGTRPQYTCTDGSAAKTCVSDNSCTNAPVCPGGWQQAQPNCPAHQKIATQGPLAGGIFCHQCQNLPRVAIGAGARCTAAQGCTCSNQSQINNGQVCPFGSINCYPSTNCSTAKSFTMTSTQDSCADFDAFDTQSQCNAGTASESNCYDAEQGCGLRTVPVSSCQSPQYYPTENACTAYLTANNRIICWNASSGTCVKVSSPASGGSTICSGNNYATAGECAAASSGGNTGGSSCPASQDIKNTARRACLSDPYNLWNEDNCACTKQSVDPNVGKDGKKSFKGCRQACNDKDGCTCSTACSNATPNGEGGYNPGTVNFTQACPDYRDEDRCRIGSSTYQSSLRACNCSNGKVVPIGFKCSAPCEDGFGNNNEGMVSCAPNGNIRKCFNGTWTNIDGKDAALSAEYGACGGTGIDDCAPTSERECALGKEPGDRCGVGGTCIDVEPYGDGFFTQNNDTDEGPDPSYYGDLGETQQKICECKGETQTTATTTPTPTPGTGGGGGTTTYSCNSDCTSDSQCQSADSRFTCSSGKCRLGTNPGSATCQPPTGPMCLNIGMKDAQGSPVTKPTLGQSVNFECGAVSGASRYIFRVIEPDGTITALTANGRNSSAYTVDQSGTYQAQCQICTGAGDDTCHAYEPLN